LLKGVATKQIDAILLAIRPSLCFLVSQWWLYAFTVYYVYIYGSQYYAFTHSFDALAAAYISLLIHVVLMIYFEYCYKGWQTHGAAARIVYIVVAYDLHACFTFPVIWFLLESRWGRFGYFGGFSSDGSWAMLFMLFMVVYTPVGLIAGAVAAARLIHMGKSGRGGLNGD
jgi:hypothetical protein